MKIKIVYKNPPITDQEIIDRMNFHRLLQERNAFVKASNSKRVHRFKVISAFAMLLTLFGTIGFFFFENDKPKVAFVAPNSQLILDWQTLPLKNRPLADSISALESSPAIQTNKQSLASSKNIKIEITDKQIEEANTPKAIAYKSNYKEAYPLVGMDSLLNYFNTYLIYPKDTLSKSNPISGSATAFFTIDTTGKAIAIKIENSLGASFDQEAIRLIKGIPLWKPARLNDKLTESQLSIPLWFKPTEATTNY
ncbi:MAG: hypothetical protein ACJAT1_000843 [Marivirga sp.]|jgi:hypothetical protein